MSLNYCEEKEGNIFFIPLFLPNNIKNNRKSYFRYKFDVNNKYAFGRLIEVDKSGGDLIEIFNYVGNIPSNANVIIESGLMFKPLHMAMAFSKKRWRFIFDNPKYNRNKDSNYQNISFLLGDEDKPILWQGGQKKPYKGNMNLYDRWIVYPPTKLEDMIREKITN